MIADQKLTIYDKPHVHLFGEIKDGCLHLVSEVYGDDYDSEKHYLFDKEETQELFDIISLGEFINLCRERHLTGLEKFLKKTGVTYKTFVF